MASRKREVDDNHFLGSHFTTTGELSVNEDIRGAGPDTLKHVLLEHLLEGETVTRALKRLRPTPRQVGNKKRRQIGGSQRQRAADAVVEADKFLLELEGNAEDKAKEEERKKRAFNQVTEAASELMEIGYEDIYTDTRESIQASSKGGAAGSQHKSMYVWHDDGVSAPRKRDAENDITSFKDLPRSSGSAKAGGPTQGVPDPENKGGSGQRQPGQDAQRSAAPVSAKGERDSAAAAAAGAVSFQTAVPFQYPEPKQPQPARPPAVPKMAPLPPPPGGFRDQTPSGQPGSQPFQASQPHQHQHQHQEYAGYAQSGYPAQGPLCAYPQYPPQGPGQYDGPYMPQAQWQYAMQGQPQQPQYAYQGQYQPHPPYPNTPWPT